MAGILGFLLLFMGEAVVQNPFGTVEPEYQGPRSLPGSASVLSDHIKGERKEAVWLV